MTHGTATHDEDRQVLVVGGGVEGLAAAAFLRARGFDPVVVGGQRPRAPRGVTLRRAAVDRLETLGVCEALKPAVGVERWVVRTLEGETIERFAATGDRPPCLRLERSRLVDALCTRVPNERYWVEQTPRTLERTTSGAIVTFDCGVRERFDLVVGADGRGSWVRADGFDVPPPERTGMPRPFDTDPRLDARNTVHELWFPDGSLARVGPLPDADCGQFVLREPKRDARVGPLTVNGDRQGTGIISRVDGTGDRACWPGRWVTAETALIGEAATPLAPLVSTAPSIAIEDSYALAEELTLQLRTKTALRSYEGDRRTRFRRLLDAPSGADDPRRHQLSFLRASFGGNEDGDGVGNG